MKMNEIITVSPESAVEMSDKDVAKVAAFFSKTAGIELPHGLEVREQADASYRWLGLFKNDDLMGWVKLRPTKVGGIDVFSIELVYLLPKYRKTIAAGWLFLYAKDIVGSPLVLGDDTNYGGVAYSDGEALMKALQRTGKFHLSLINTKTGEKSPLEFPLKDNRFTTVMIESLVDLNVVGHLAESHAVPGESTREQYQREVDWLGKEGL